MTPQERFKKYLAGDYDTVTGLDAALKLGMTAHGWIYGSGKISYSARHNFFGYEGDRDWHEDIKEILQRLDNEQT